MFCDNVAKEQNKTKQNNCVSTSVELSGFTVVVSLDVVFHFWPPPMRRKHVKSPFHPPGAASLRSDFTAGLPPPATPPQRVAAVKWGAGGESCSDVALNSCSGKKNGKGDAKKKRAGLKKLS